MIRVTAHAIQRFQQRIFACSFEEARAAILSHTRALEAAVRFGAEVVRLADGSRLILEGNAVVTVYERGCFPRQCRSPLTAHEDGQPL